MKQFRRVFFFLVLNVLVSACTTVAVLYAWDQSRGPLPKGLLPQAWTAWQATPTANAITTPVAPGEAPIQALPTDTFIAYQVQVGDTFASIAERFNISVEELLNANGFTQDQPLGIGEVLRVPSYLQGSVTIQNVIGVGDLETERILLKHRGQGELSLVGWRIEDGQGRVFIFPQFPQLVLFGGGAVNIYTKAGSNSVVDMFWGLDNAIWYPGATVTLKDAQGNVRAVYTVP